MPDQLGSDSEGGLAQIDETTFTYVYGGSGGSGSSFTSSVGGSGGGARFMNVISNAYPIGLGFSGFAGPIGIAGSNGFHTLSGVWGPTGSEILEVTPPPPIPKVSARIWNITDYGDRWDDIEGN